MFFRINGFFDGFLGFVKRREVPIFGRFSAL
nr:MAG TPA: hypothetical protein [Caudoviricetes sp.]DAN98737.1 MAG TPA: hypothetical protein [Caudoviricetes sp.]